MRRTAIPGRRRRNTAFAAAATALAAGGLAAAPAGNAAGVQGSPRSAGQIVSTHRQVIALSGYLKRPGDFVARQLVRVNPRTLQPLPGATALKLSDSTSGHVLGPSGRAMAFGGQNFGRLLIVDLAPLAVRRTIAVAHGPRFEVPAITAVSWPRPDLVVAYSQLFVPQAEAPARLLLVNPRRHHAVRSVSLHGSVQLARRTPGGGAVFLVSRTNHVSAARLVLVRPNGSVSSVRLSRVRAGFNGGQDRDPGLLVTPSGSLVVAPDNIIADVDLGSLTVSYHHVPGLMRAREPAPPAQDEGSAGPLHAVSRNALRFGRNSMVVSGGEGDPAKHTDKIRYLTQVTDVVDLQTWRVIRKLPHFPDVDRADGVDLGERIVYRAHDPDGTVTGLRVFDRRIAMSYTLPLAADRYYRVMGNHLIIGGSEHRSRAVIRDLQNGARIRTLPAGSLWQDGMVVVPATTPAGTGDERER
jgi:hypothetical protein